MSPAMVAYYKERLASPWWKPEADEAAQWVADWCRDHADVVAAHAGSAA